MNLIDSMEDTTKLQHNIGKDFYCVTNFEWISSSDKFAYSCPGYDVKLIRCCPQYNVKLMWRHRGNDIVSVAAICVAAICAAAQLIFVFGRTWLAV